MSMDSLGGNMPAGQPIAVTSGNRTHVFAIDAGGVMNHWTSLNGGPWTGPAPCLGQPRAVVPCGHRGCRWQPACFRDRARRAIGPLAVDGWRHMELPDGPARANSR